MKTKSFIQEKEMFLANISTKQENSFTKQWFTLIELLVVLWILAILSVVWMMSWQSVAKDSRNSTRLTNLKTIESWLKIQFTQWWAYAVPDNYATITASWTEIRKQWVFGTTGLRTIKASTNASTDPLTQEYYTYVTDRYLQQYQLVWNMEGENVAYNSQFSTDHPQPLLSKEGRKTPLLSSLLSKEGVRGWSANASTLTGYTIKSLGSDLWIIYSGSTEMHKSFTWTFDVRNTTSLTRIVFAEWDEITSSSGSELFSNIYNRDKLLLQNKELAKLDDSLVEYWDMESLVSDWILKSFWKNWNNAIFSWPISLVEWISWKWIASNSSTWQVLSDFNPTILSKDFTISVWVKFDNFNNNYPHIISTEGHNWINFHWMWNVYWINNKKITFYLQANNSQLDRSNFMWGSLWNKKTELEWHNIVISRKLWLSNMWIDWAIDQSSSSYNNLNYSWTKISFLNWYTPNWNQKLNWTIDEVRIYNRALSEKEIKAVYESTVK